MEGKEGSAVGGPAPSEASELIARQAEEIARLRRRLADERFAEELREALSLAAAAGTIAAPVTHSRLLELIVATAAQVIAAGAASLFLIDEEREELVFEVALGQKAEEVKKFRVPLGHGIAGLVAVTGQPMAIAEAQHDPRLAADIARSVGYIPRSILCVPLFYDDRVTGVLELLDKIGAPSFHAGDMETLGLFANQAAVAIEQSRANRNLGALLGETLRSLEGGAGLAERARAFAARTEEEDLTTREALDLAALVQEIARAGERERRLCRTILQGFAEYLRTRPGAADGPGGLPGSL
ncbi:MAG: GAF domain-containing protein [Chloroflexota bacterium]|nr:GAF domain-containing protein [Chloroflexota bacterium]